MKRICVFGAGSFGTALGCVLARNGHEVIVVARDALVANGINKDHRNPRYFTDIELPLSFSATTDPEEGLRNANYVLHAIPVQNSEEYLKKVMPFLRPDLPIISCSKGIHATSLKYMSDVVPEVLGYSPSLAFFSGPSFARELLERQPSAVVVASKDVELAQEVQHLFASEVLRVYTTDDIVGVEIGGALKNVFAIGAGIVQGMGYGKNTMAALITRACSEMRKLAIAMGANPTTIAGLSGVGDLMLTCYGKQSRNRTVGFRLGQGENIKDIMASMTEVAEGVFTSPAALQLAKKYDLELPIVMAVAAILDGSQCPREAMRHLMTLPLSHED